MVGGDVAVEQQLALALVAPAAQRAADARLIEDLAARADLDAFLRLAAHQRLTPLLGTRRMEVPGPASPAAEASVARVVLKARRLGAVQEMLAVELLRRLEAGGVPALPLKGALLAKRLYGDVGLRVSGDIDLLVCPEHFPAAREILRNAGMGLTGPREHSAMPRLHDRFVGPHGSPVVELHWRVHWYEDEFSRQLVLGSRVTPGLGRVPRATDDLCALLLFYARDGFAGLRLVADIGAWFDAHGDDVHEPVVDRVVREHPRLAPSLTAAAVVVSGLLGLEPGRLTTAPERRRISRLANPWLRGDHEQIAAEQSLLDLLLTARGDRWAAVRRQLLAPEHLARDGDDTLPVRLEHAFLTSRRYGRALSRPLRG